MIAPVEKQAESQQGTFLVVDISSMAAFTRLGGAGAEFAGVSGHEQGSVPGGGLHSDSDGRREGCREEPRDVQRHRGTEAPTPAPTDTHRDRETQID